MKMIFVSTACLSGMRLITSCVSLYRSFGLKAIELGGGVFVDKDSLSQIVAMECQFLIHNYFPPPDDAFVLNLASGNESIREKSINFVSEALALTARLGAPFYSVHAGFITDPASTGSTGFVFANPALPDTAHLAMERFIRALEVVLERARHFGVQILIENNVCSRQVRGQLLLQTTDEFTELFRLLPSPDLGVLLDTGHLNVTAHTLNFDRLNFVDRIAPYVRAIHAHDNDGASDSHESLREGSWALEVLRRPEFNGLPVIIETRVEAIADLCQHAEWLRGALKSE